MSASVTGIPQRQFPRRFEWAGYLTGFGLSGFFDGILLHQILQWHHLLSAITRGVLGDIRGQVMADGLFHAAMYVVAAAGLWLLYRSRATLALAGANRRLLADFWIGFGVWHVVDAVFSHWITGIHRIRMDSPTPLAWDLAWLFVFGLIPLAAGIRMRIGGGPDGGGTGELARHGVAMTLLAATVAAAALNLFPVRRGQIETVMVVLRPGAPAASLFSALGDTGASVLWSDPGGGVWVLAGASAIDLFPLYGRGAMYVSGTLAPAGCSAWFRAPGAGA
ncbi:DUF2243 domain-containing protein [Pigmentiphaga soli]